MDWYSRLVAWLKVLLPLMALGILSTLFLLSRNVDPVATIPFADDEIRDRVDQQQITGPVFSGTSRNGDLISFSAGDMKTDAKGRNVVQDLSAEIELASGTSVVLRADQGAIDLANATTDIMGNVVVTTSTGFSITTDQLVTNLDTATLTTPGPVSAVTGFGTLNAGQMALSASKNGGPSQLIFTNGVKLIYDPKQIDE